MPNANDSILQGVIDDVATLGECEVYATSLENSLFRHDEAVTGEAALKQWATENGLQFSLIEETQGRKRQIKYRFERKAVRRTRP